MAFSSVLVKVPAYYKSVVAALGGVSVTLTSVLGLSDVLPHAVSGWLTAALAAVTTASVYLVKNQAVVSAVVADVTPRV